ncbi:MAG: FlgD immunoglobulin-like domain containing protein, partial [bacterium]
DLGSGKDRDIRVQRINSSGVEIEPEFDIVSAIGDQVKPALIPDKRDGVIVAWEDNRNNQTDIYAQLIEPSGNLRWGSNGVAVSTASNAQKNPVLIDDKLGGAIIVWEDRRNGTNIDIYAQKVSAPGELGEFRHITLVEPDTEKVNWEIGSTQMIKWTFRGEIDSVAIELSRDGGQTYREEDIIARAAPIDSGMVMWQVRGPASNASKIRIRAVNADFISDESTQTFTISDSIGPTLTLADTISVSSFGDSIVVTTSALDFSGVKMVYLNYRKGGSSRFELLEMPPIASDRYRKAIPADFVKEQGVEYFISSVDSIGVFSTTDTFFINVNFESGVETQQIARGSSQNAYRMISAPNFLDQTLADSIFAVSGFGAYDTTSWRLFDYRNNEYIERDSLNANTFVFTPGSAYWLISAKDRTIDFGTGHSLRVDSPDTITLDPGWNQISVPFAFAVEWDLVLSASDNPTVTKPFLYTGSYATMNSLEPYKGYFVFNQENQNINLLIPAVAFEQNNNAASKGTFLAEAEWEIQINSLCQQARDDFNLVGIHEQASQNWDALDYPEPPPIGKYISVYFPRKEWKIHPNNYTTDYRNAVGQGQTWSFRVKTNIPNSEAKLTFSGVESLPPNLEIWLLDEKLNITKNLKRENFYTFPTGHFGTTKTLKLLVGRNEYLASETSDIDLIPKEFELSQNFPNPFNPITSIRYALPRTAHVHLQVFDLLGKEVTTLLDHELKEAGFHLITWNGKDAKGGDVASGLYFYRLQAGDFIQSRKAIYLK